jgi:hypothetical protein
MIKNSIWIKKHRQRSYILDMATPLMRDDSPDGSSCFKSTGKIFLENDEMKRYSRGE